MRLSSLRSWLGARDNNLILGPSLVWSRRALLSRRYRTHAAWRQNPSPAQAACTLGSSGTGHRLSQYPSRRLHSHQSFLEGGEPHAVSLDPAEAATGFQARRVRARQTAEAKISEKAASRIANSRYSKPQPSKTLDSKNTKLGKALRIGAAQKARRRGHAEPAKFQEHDDQEFVIRDSSSGKEAQQHFDYWAPATAADAVHMEALQKAHEAARKAEQIALWAERLTASVAKGSQDEKHTIEKALRADIARTQAELAASDAKRMALHAAEKGKAYEALRAELLAALETHPKYLENDNAKFSKVISGRKLKALIPGSCPICQTGHSLSQCKVLFDDLPADPRLSSTLKYARRWFQDRLEFDKDMREGMSYITSNFTVSKGPTPAVVPLNSQATVDAPASARSESSMPQVWLGHPKPELASSTKYAHIQVESICRCLITAYFSEQSLANTGRSK